MSKAYLILSDGSVFEGTSFGAPVSAVGELVFTTGVVGYLETLTDPAYAGQIILQTFPAIGNYGVIEEDFDGEFHASGYVVHEWCDTPSNFRAQYDIDRLLKDQGIPGICGVDTRALTRRLRDHGPMNAMIAAEIPADLTALQNYKITGAVEKVTCSEIISIPGDGPHAVMIDGGAKPSIVNALSDRGCRVTVVPANTSADEILALSPDGVLVSGGPGDPADASVPAVKALLGRLPMFGISLGHQLIALAAGGSAMKMPYGHRGSSQPVKELASGRTFITEQNHGYCIEVVKNGVISFVNANDGTCEGADYPTLNAFGVQFYPDAEGPRSTAFLYDRFITMMGGEN